MSEQPSQSKHSFEQPTEELEKPGFNMPVTLWVPMVLPIVYIFSIGPAIIVHQKAPQGAKDTIEMFYAPLEWLADNTPLEKPLRWYVEQWE